MTVGEQRDLRTEVRELIASELDLGIDPATIPDERPLIDNYPVDSLSLLRLVEAVEVRYDIEVADHELVPENVGSIAAIARLIGRKLDG